MAERKERRMQLVPRCVGIPMPSCVAEWPTPIGCVVLGKPPNRIGKSVPEDRSVMGWLERCQDGLSAVSHLLLCN